MENSLQVTLPEPIRDWVEAQARAGGYSTVSDYVRHLLETEHRRLINAEIDEQLHAGLDSGPATPMTPADWARLRQEGRKRLASRREPS
jgi:antitoxin ParD1/3/4